MLISLADVRWAAELLKDSAANRDRVIRGAHENGNTIRAIAEAANLSPSRVHQILHTP